MTPYTPFRTRLIVPVLLFLFMAATVQAEYLEISPFTTTNRNPLTQIYGLPAETSSDLNSSGQWRFSLVQDIASIYSVSSSATEQILLDGELYRWTLTGRYGITDNLEAGIEVPFVLQSGGFLDTFIIDWHKTFGLPQGGRDTAPKNRLRYRYDKNGRQLLTIRNSSGGVGDIAMLAGYKLFEQRTESDLDRLALRAQLKLPSGDSSNLMGSGSVDLALLLTGSMNRTTEWGMLGIFASAGGMVATDGDILADQRENLVGLGTAGLGWSPSSWIAFKVQLHLNTPLFKSSLSDIGKGSALLTSGGSLKLPGNYLLDIGVGEDIGVGTAPDVTFHLGLSKRF